MAQRDYKEEYRKFQSSPEMIAYRSELNKANKDNPNSKKGDKMDMSHKGGKLVLEDQSVNRGRSGEGGRKIGVRKKKTAKKGMRLKKGGRPTYAEGGQMQDWDLLKKVMSFLGFMDPENESNSEEVQQSSVGDQEIYGGIPYYGGVEPAIEPTYMSEDVVSLPEVEVAAKEEKKPFMKIRKKIGENRMENFKDDLNEYGDIYRSAVDAAISKESGTKGVEGFNVAEDLGYSTKQLLKTFPGKLKKAGYGTDTGYDTLRIENELTYNPRALGDAMYGPIGGYDFRGRGYVQITGKDNYRKVSRDLFGDDRLLENPDLIMANEEIARKAAISYLGMTQKGTLKRMKKWGLIDKDQEVNDLSQEDANLFVLFQVSGSGWNPTVLKGLKRMDEQTGVVRDYDALDARIKAGKAGKNK